MTEQILTIIHVVVSIGIVGLVLIQHGKGADAGAAFGSGASGTVFGSGGSASFLTRLTAVFAAGFFITSLALAMYAGTYRSGESVVTGTGERVTTGEESEAGADESGPPSPGKGESGSSGQQESAPAPGGSGGSSDQPDDSSAPSPGGS